VEKIGSRFLYLGFGALLASRLDLEVSPPKLPVWWIVVARLRSFRMEIFTSVVQEKSIKILKAQ
jgi:hypothetical protein